MGSAGANQQDDSPSHRAGLARKLPRNLKAAIRGEYTTTAREETDKEAEAALWEQIGGSDVLGTQLVFREFSLLLSPFLTWRQT